MKNKNILMMLLLGALITATIFSGCKKDDDDKDDDDNDNVQNCKVFKSKSLWETIIYDYDEQGRLSTGKDTNGNILIAVTYRNNQTEFDDFSLSEFFTLTYNSNNQPLQLTHNYHTGTTTYNATYSSTGQLQEVNYVRTNQNSILNGSGSYTNIVYSEGNIVSLQNTFTQDNSGIPHTENFVYTYYDKENSPSFDPTIIFSPFNLRGGITSFSKQRIKSYEMMRLSNGDTESYNYTYQYDADGKVVKASFAYTDSNGVSFDTDETLEYVCN